MVFTPNSKIFLLNTVLCEDQNNQLDFTSVTAQTSYFLSRVVGSFSYEDCTYVRKDNVLKVPASLDQLWNVNYVMYQNTMFTNKWFYCFIVGRKYINDNCTELTLKTDVFQSWMFDYDILPSFVEREHVDDDTVGLHTLPEGLETGPYIINEKIDLFTGGNTCYICVATSELPDEYTMNTKPRQYGKIYSGVSYLVFDIPLSASNFILAMSDLGKKDAIYSVFMIPTSLCGDINFQQITLQGEGYKHAYATNVAFPEFTTSETVMETSSSFSIPTSLNGYTPKNNKLKTFPYSYFYISNNVGTDVDFRYEDFINNTVQFKTIGTITPGCSIKCFPLNYKKLQDNNSMKSYNYGISGPKYPICSWNSDVFTNWLTQNGVNIGLSLASSALSTGIGIATGNPIGIASGVLSIASSLGSVYEHSIIPDSAQGNINSGDITFSSNNMTIPAFKMSIKQEYAKIIDKFFSMFGYKVNEVKSPNLSSRQNWNYIKTSNVIIEGQAPDEDIDELKNIFNKGITIWHNPATFGDYSQSNNIV